MVMCQKQTCQTGLQDVSESPDVYVYNMVEAPVYENCSNAELSLEPNRNRTLLLMACFL